MKAKQKPLEPYDPSKPLYDSWGTKFDAKIHAMSKGQPLQNKEGRFKFMSKIKKKFKEELNQSEFGLNDPISSKKKK